MMLALVLPNRHLARPAADDDFVICPKPCVDKCLCCQADDDSINHTVCTVLF